MVILPKHLTFNLKYLIFNLVKLYIDLTTALKYGRL
nr:MAG TPA: hypothetical protein [Herelleviridae sp.]